MAIQLNLKYFHFGGKQRTQNMRIETYFVTDRGKWRDSCMFLLQLRPNVFIFKGGKK